MVTSDPGMTAPLASETVPWMPVSADCAAANGAAMVSEQRTSARNVWVLRTEAPRGVLVGVAEKTKTDGDSLNPSSTGAASKFSAHCTVGGHRGLASLVRLGASRLVRL